MKNNIKWTVIVITNIVFINACMTNVPDTFFIDYDESITSYQIYKRILGYVSRIERQIIPGRSLEINFWYSTYGYYYNSNHLLICGRLYITKPYKKLYIKEISYNFNGKNFILLTDETFDINDLTEKDILVDENDEPIIINGEKIYWTSVDFNKKIKHHFIKGFINVEKEIEIISIYSFDDEELREEKFRYKVICGGIRFDPMRPILMFFPP